MRRLFRRRIVVLFALIGGLITLVALDRAAADWRTVVTGEAGALLYAASFDGAGADGFNRDWDQYEGRLAASIADGMLRFDIDESNGAPFSLPPSAFTDFDVRIRAQAVAGDLANNGYGVIFRLQDADNHYRFLISSDGYYRVVRTLNGEQKELSAWIPSPVIQQGMNLPNDLRVVGRGGQFQFFINAQRVQVCTPDDPNGVSTYSGGTCYGTMQDELADASFGVGRVGVTAESLDLGSAVGVTFDHVLIFSPDA
ncbi:MAG: hypothetical protein SGI73_13545 [Chloroflexota bacterium]|nr:hypothetical protein [Chloroflexota bacterium]